MPRRHDSPIPLMLGLIFAVAVHIAAAAPASHWLTRTDRPPVPPDLRVENIIVPEDVLILSQPNHVRFTVANRGSLPTPDTSWDDRVYFSLDDHLSKDDVQLIAVTHTGSLAPGDDYRVEVPALLLPDDVKPPFYLIFQTDALNAVDERWLEHNNTRARRFDPPDEKQEPDVALGKPDEPQRVTVAWISHDDFEELVAKQSVTEQPALQSVTEPVPAAPMELDPTPPNALPSPDEPATPAEVGGSLAESATAVAPEAPTVAPAPDPVVAVAPVEGDSKPAQPDLQQTPGEGDSTTEAAAASKDEPAKPTQVPRDEGEAAPTQRFPQRIDVHPGSTLVGEGIEIKTARPDFSAIARVSTVPEDVEAELTFDRTGTVLDARILKSSGSVNVDAPLLRSFYKWKAKGKQIEDLKGKLIVPIRVILRD